MIVWAVPTTSAHLSTLAPTRTVAVITVDTTIDRSGAT